MVNHQASVELISTVLTKIVLPHLKSWILYVPQQNDCNKQLTANATVVNKQGKVALIVKH